jgi:hypothetical protein
MKSPYTKIKRLDIGESKLQQVLKLAACLGAIVMTIAAITSIVRTDQPANNGAVETERRTDTLNEATHTDTLNEATHTDTLNELTQLDTFKEAYLSANGNDTLRQRTHTIHMVGQIQNGETSQTFSLTKKRPDQLLFSIDLAAHKMTIGVSGDTVWRRIRSPQHKDHFTLIEGEQAKHWLHQRRFFDQIIDATQGAGSITAIETSTWKESACLQVTTLDTDGISTKTLVDPQTMYPIAELHARDDGTTKLTTYSDYRKIDGIPLPFQIESSIDGKPLSRIRLKSAKLNSGVLSALFKVPESLLTND